jgi:hypothetical protein
MKSADINNVLEEPAASFFKEGNWADRDKTASNIGKEWQTLENGIWIERGTEHVGVIGRNRDKVQIVEVVVSKEAGNNMEWNKTKTQYYNKFKSQQI